MSKTVDLTDEELTALTGPYAVVGRPVEADLAEWVADAVMKFVHRLRRLRRRTPAEYQAELNKICRKYSSAG